jgi:hypothetical protein
MATRPKGYLTKGKTKSVDAVRKAKAKEAFTPKGIGGMVAGALLSGAPIGRGGKAAVGVAKIIKQAVTRKDPITTAAIKKSAKYIKNMDKLERKENKVTSLASAKTRANIDKMEKSGAYKKVGTPAPKAAPVSKSTKPKPSTKEVVGRTMRKRAHPKLTPKDPLLQQPATKLESLKKKQHLSQLMSRPVVRNREIPKRSTQSLTPNEKLYEKLGERARVTVTNKKPMSKKEIKKEAGKARKAKFNKVLSPRPKPKPNRVPLKPIDKSRGSNAPVKPKLSDDAQKLENAKNNPRNWEIADQRPKSNIAQGRGDIQQPTPITKNPRPARTEKRSVRVEARNARRAEKRDRRTDVRGSKRADYTKPRYIKYVTGPKSATPGITKRIKIADQTISRTNHPRNTASDAGNMEERLKAVDNIIRQKVKQKELYQGNNKISAKTKNSVDKTLETSRILRKRLKAANRASKPTPRVKQRLSKTRPVTPK